jgi:hypothetical protein
MSDSSANQISVPGLRGTFVALVALTGEHGWRQPLDALRLLWPAALLGRQLEQ